MKCEKLMVMFTAWICSVLLSAPMIASGEENQVISLERGQPSPYKGVLLPEGEYYFLEAAKAERDVCIKNLSDLPSECIPQPSFIYSDALKISFGVFSFALCSMIAAQDENQAKSYAGCALGAGALTLVYMLD